MPYEYRRMTPEQREAIVRLRAARGYPLHSPPHPINEKTYYATLNYIHYNPVRHNCSKCMDEWEWSSFSWYLEEMGRDWLVEIWKQYPIKNYGDKWDIF
jgi:hypothetical protein